MWGTEPVENRSSHWIKVLQHAKPYYAVAPRRGVPIQKCQPHTFCPSAKGSYTLNKKESMYGVSLH